MANSEERNMIAKTTLRPSLSHEQLKRLTANCIHGATGDIVCALMRAHEEEDRKKARDRRRASDEA